MGICIMRSILSKRFFCFVFENQSQVKSNPSRKTKYSIKSNKKKYLSNFLLRCAPFLLLFIFAIWWMDEKWVLLSTKMSQEESTPINSSLQFFVVFLLCFMNIHENSSNSEFQYDQIGIYYPHKMNEKWNCLSKTIKSNS